LCEVFVGRHVFTASFAFANAAVTVSSGSPRMLFVVLFSSLLALSARDINRPTSLSWFELTAPPVARAGTKLLEKFAFAPSCAINGFDKADAAKRPAPLTRLPSVR
jgi:hypothetical protein